MFDYTVVSKSGFFALRDVKTQSDLFQKQNDILDDKDKKPRKYSSYIINHNNDPFR
jgi:hypothetical protein